MQLRIYVILLLDHSIVVYAYNSPKLGPLTTELGTQVYYDKFSSKQKIQLSLLITTNSLRQQKFVIVVYVYNFTVLCPFVTKLGTLMYCDKVSSTQKLHVCKQQQTVSGKEKL